MKAWSQQEPWNETVPKETKQGNQWQWVELTVQPVSEQVPGCLFGVLEGHGQLARHARRPLRGAFLRNLLRILSTFDLTN